MSWRLVDRVPGPHSVGGPPALDFCNPRAGWGAPAPKEYLTRPRVLAVWGRETGLLPTESSTSAEPAAGPPADDGLARALGRREPRYARALHRGDPDQWALVSRESARARAAG